MTGISRLAGLAVFCLLTMPLSAATEHEAWSRLSERLVFGQCQHGSQEAGWADHYAAHPAELGRALAQAEPWMAWLADELVRRDLPGELALLPIVESAYDPFAWSSRGAAGPWQLMPETAREQGLEISPWYDARRDMLAATGAALDYLEQMYRQLDQRWDLAIAAYNAGPGRVSRALAERGRNADWTELALPGETRVYLARIQGLSCLLGRSATGAALWPRSAGDATFEVLSLPGPVDLVAVAAITGIDPQTLLALNAGLGKLLTPPTGPHRLLVPNRSADQVRSSLARHQSAGVLIWGEGNIRRRDSLAGIARRHDVSLRSLKQINGMNGQLPTLGQRLVLPAAVSPSQMAGYRQKLDQMLALQQGQLPERRLRHHVADGENLWALSQRYSVPISAIRQANGMGTDAPIKAGQWIEIPPGEAQAGPDHYRIQPGDTLSTIARDHGMPLARLKQLNQIGGDATLRPGELLFIGEPRCCAQIPSLFLP